MACCTGSQASQAVQAEPCYSSAAISCLYSSVAERQYCKLKVLGSIPSGGFVLSCVTGTGSQASQAVQSDSLYCAPALSCLYSSVAERHSCNLKVLASIPSGGFVLSSVTGLLRVTISTSRLSYLADCNAHGLLHWQPGKSSSTDTVLILRCSS